MKMWQGRFKKEEDLQVNDFNSSVRFDMRMYKQDISGSIAHAKMLGKQNIISQKDSETIVCGLYGILSDIESGKLKIDMSAEDIHMFVEEELTKRIGNCGKMLHTSRSRNDQVALDTRMYVSEEIENITGLLKNLCGVIIEIAKNNMGTIMPGYTHLQRAQPVTFAHYILAYAQMFKRDIERLCDCKKRTLALPLGACALAGTTYDIDRFYVAEELGFNGVCENSIDAVSDRDFALEFSFCLSLIMTHLSRFSEEIILWCSSEFSFIELDDAFSTGSSIMPQKKNPDVAELVRGKTGRVYGSLMSLLTVMKGLPLAYNKDMQEDKEMMFDAIDNTKNCISTFSRMFETISVKKDKMRDAANFGFINATDCADYLVKKGVPFRTAYKAVGELVAVCIEKGLSFETLPISEYKSVCELFDNDVYDAVNIDNCVNRRKVFGGPSEESVNTQIASLEKFLKNI